MAGSKQARRHSRRKRGKNAGIGRDFRRFLSGYHRSHGIPRELPLFPRQSVGIPMTTRGTPRQLEMITVSSSRPPFFLCASARMSSGPLGNSRIYSMGSCWPPSFPRDDIRYRPEVYGMALYLICKPGWCHVSNATHGIPQDTAGTFQGLLHGPHGISRNPMAFP